MIRATSCASLVAIGAAVLYAGCTATERAGDGSEGPGASATGKADDHGYDVRYRGVGFDDHDGDDVYVALTVGYVHDGPTAYRSTTVRGGTFEVAFEAAVTNDFDITVYVDEDGDGSCAAGEPQWRDFYTDTFGDSQLVVDAEEVEYGDHYCDRFARAAMTETERTGTIATHYEGRGFERYDGHAVYAAVKRRRDGGYDEVARSEATVVDGQFTLDLEGLPAGVDLNHFVFIDEDEDGSCAPETDLAWHEIYLYEGSATTSVTAELAENAGLHGGWPDDVIEATRDLVCAEVE